MVDLIKMPRVGIGTMILKGDKVLLFKRKGAHGAGEYAFPGGHLEYMESFEECARREVQEEVGIEIDNVFFLLLANITAYAPKHYTHITLKADWKSGEPRICEPDKAEEIGWYDLSNLPSPMSKMCTISFEALKTKQNYFDGL